MKKRALIIKSFTDPSDRDFRSGIDADAKGYAAFLRSANGGGWVEGKEFVVLTNPSAIDLQGWVRKLDGADIAHVYYSGHGYRDSSFDRDYININPRERFAVRQLQSSALRQVTIVDACRADPSWSHFDGGLAGFAGHPFDFSDLDFAREAYANIVMNGPKGHAILYSCSVGEYSYCNPFGGFFTQSLFKAVGAQNAQGTKVGLSVEGWGNAAEAFLNEYGEQQTPSLYGVQSLEAVKIPIVILPKVVRRVSNQSAQEPPMAKQPRKGWVRPVLGLAVVSLAIIALAKS